MESVKKLFGLGQYQTIYVKSSVDGKEYLVRDLPDKQGAADLLAKVRIKLNNLKIHLEQKYPVNQDRYNNFDIYLLLQLHYHYLTKHMV